MSLHKVLMFGWEFPPHINGGLGVACLGLTKAIAMAGDDITFVLPKVMEVATNEGIDTSHFVFDGATFHPELERGDEEVKIKMHHFDSILTPYLTSELYKEEFTTIVNKKSFHNNNGRPVYAANLVEEVYRYADVVDKIQDLQSFDMIHCHDWLTVPPALKAKEITGKPLVIHIHATEFDRTGGWINKQIFEIEKLGMQNADQIIAVSEYTKNSIVEHYDIDPNKITVVHNGIDYDYHKSDDDKNPFSQRLMALKNAGYQLVLFTGRLTFQKGVDYLLDAAKKALSYNHKTLFIIVGSGDMEQKLIHQAVDLKIADRVVFTGFMKGDQLKSLYQMADLFIMPSVSEPFGLVALESAVNNTPVIISKQSGVSEVFKNSLKVDFWDTDEMANHIVGVLEYESLRNVLTTLAHAEAKQLSWHKSAKKIKHLYHRTIEGFKKYDLVKV
jgi:glycogen synthase